jgi:hypothetical protein
MNLSLFHLLHTSLLAGKGVFCTSLKSNLATQNATSVWKYITLVIAAGNSVDSGTHALCNLMSPNISRMLSFLPSHASKVVVHVGSVGL